MTTPDRRLKNADAPPVLSYDRRPALLLAYGREVGFKTSRSDKTLFRPEDDLRRSP